MFKFPATKLELTKFIVSKVASYGTGVIVARAIANTTAFPSESLNLPKKVAITVAGAVIASIIQTAVVKHTDKLIDDFVDGYQEFMHLRQQSKEA